MKGFILYVIPYTMKMILNFHSNFFSCCLHGLMDVAPWLFLELNNVSVVCFIICRVVTKYAESDVL